jgi:peptide chain release factor subunit 1
MKELIDTTLTHHLDELAAFGPTGYPFVSLYLNTQPDQHGRDNFDSFVRKEFRERAKIFTVGSLERESFERDVRRIKAYLQEELRPSANGLAIFACAGEGNYFKALQLDASINQHQLHVYYEPHLYPLARLIDQHPRYVALLADTNAARLFVFGLGRTVNSEEVQSVKVSRTQVGGWSQMRYQRHVGNYHLHHTKEVIEMLERVVREEAAEHIVLAGDEVIIPLLREQLPPQLAEKVIDVLRLDIRTPEHEVLKATMENLREHDIKSDAEKVGILLEEYRSGGLAVVGARDTLAALRLGQVDELLLSASIEGLRDDEEEVGEAVVCGVLSGSLVVRSREPRLAVMADTLVTQARLTGARVTFIEDQALLADMGGVGARLRFRL